MRCGAEILAAHRHLTSKSWTLINEERARARAVRDGGAAALYATTVQILLRRVQRWKQILFWRAKLHPRHHLVASPVIIYSPSLTDAGGFIVVAGATGEAKGRGVGCEEEGRNSSGGAYFWWTYQHGEKDDGLLDGWIWTLERAILPSLIP
ncbi:hypothetical protein SEVIR_9G079850v4 [Setaria viridis]